MLSAIAQATASAPTERRPAGKCAWRWRLFPPTLFALALLIRLAYNCLAVEHRLLTFADSYNYLRTGSCILNSVSNGGIGGVWTELFPDAMGTMTTLEATCSQTLAGRLIVDGPVYPLFLAFTEWISAVNAANPIFETIAVKLAVCNSILDALVCVIIYFCGRLAFNRRTGIIAGMLFALYPPAIVNTQICDSEPFAYFLLASLTAVLLTTNLRHCISKLKMSLLVALTGVLAACLILTRPAFAFLPPVLAVALLLPRFMDAAARHKMSSASTLTKFVARAVIFAASALVVLLPWGFFNKANTGTFALFVNRCPGLNLYCGNNIHQDGWRTYPYTGNLPTEVNAAVDAISRDAAAHPARFVNLQLRKVARLWAGAWNDYHVSLFGLGSMVQNIFHQLLLLFAALGAVQIISRTTQRSLSRSFAAAALLSSIALFHFVYVAFESLARYAVTAMPAVTLLGAFALAKASRNGKQLLTLLASGVLLTLFLSRIDALSGLLSALLPPEWLNASPFICGMLGALSFVAFWKLAWHRLVSTARVPLASAREKPSKLPIGCMTAIVLLPASVVFACAVGSPQRNEWKTVLNSHEQIVEQLIDIPAQAGQNQAKAELNQAKNVKQRSMGVILLDATSEELAPPIAVELNDVKLTEEPVPFAQFQPYDEPMIRSIAFEGHAQDKDFRSFRQWWAVPVPADLIRYGPNRITIRATAESPITIFGDFETGNSSKNDTAGKTCSRDDRNNGLTLSLPSLNGFTFSGGFSSCEGKDPRVPENVNVLSSARHSRYFNGKVWNESDMSDAVGRQHGAYRIFLALKSSETDAGARVPSVPQGVRTSAPTDRISTPSAPVSPPSKESMDSHGANEASDTYTIFGSSPNLVAGNNPATMVPKHSPFAVGIRRSGSRLQFSCELQGVNTRTAFVAVELTATDGDKSITWSSIWQPTCIPVRRTWTRYSFSDVIPPAIANQNDLKASVLVSPFQLDLIHLKPKKAQKARMFIRNASISFLPPLSLARTSSHWRLY
ncbi:MAG TPA: hypothetical protein V6D17_19075 [Candidatus Obscuribacterales bacterium]